MIKRKQKRNPLKDDNKLMRKIAELLARAIEKEPDGITAYLLAAELIRRDSLYCEECQSFDIKEDCDWNICYPEIYDLVEESSLDSAKEAAEELAEDLGIVDYVRVFRYEIQNKKYTESENDCHEPNIDLSGANLSGIDLSGIDLSYINLSKANLESTILSKVNLEEANLKGANLKGANLKGANLCDANLCRADLSGANLSEADLTRADLILARLNSADLSEAKLYGASLFRTDFSYAKITKLTNFKKARDIHETINLIIPNPRKISSNDKKKTKKKSIKRR